MPPSAAIAGLLTGLTLIVAIGSQNAYVLRLGLVAPRTTVAAVAAFCALSDAALIAVGVAGVGALSTLAPWALTLLRLGGVAFLVVYGVLSLRRALSPGAGLEAAKQSTPRVGAAVATVAAFTWLNPHVYLDTILFLGSVGAGFGVQRWWFAAGAICASVLWFFSLGFGARLLRPIFAKAWTWRILDGLIALIMFGIAASLVVELLRS